MDCVAWHFFSFLVCSLLESVLQRGAGSQEEPACSPCPGCSRLGGECCSVVQAGSCAGHGEPRAGGGTEGHNAGEPVAGWRQRDCQGELGANSRVLRMLKRKTFCKDLEGTAKSLLRFKHPEEASGLRARLEKRVYLQGHSETGEGWFRYP